MCKRGFYNVEKGAMEDMCPVDVPKAVDAAHTGFLEGDKSPTGHKQGASVRFSTDDGNFRSVQDQASAWGQKGQRPYIIGRMALKRTSEQARPNSGYSMRELH
ncbi:hypothetical protein An02g03370 [Aspergillus niger]|uniref:Uncharacterized protein n=2 Tax=Aspergillus niger TaxID=5061 RepID=A2QCF3_ASPNC|nr:hypothetical protein An02g03370 [Aspergillus niger]CAK47617.1 hypothetical protein An02g03370 [Aspergillus niger]